MQKKIKNYPSKLVQDARQLEILKRKIKIGDFQPPLILAKENSQKDDGIREMPTIIISVIKCYVYGNINNSWGPNSRESATLNVLNNNLYLYGGTGVNKLDEVIIA